MSLSKALPEDDGIVMIMSWDFSFEDGVTTTLFIRKMSDSYS